METYRYSAGFCPLLRFWAEFGAMLQRCMLHRWQLAKTDRLWIQWSRGRGEVSIVGRHSVQWLWRRGRGKRGVLNMDRNLLQSLVQVKLHLCWAATT